MRSGKSDIKIRFYESKKPLFSEFSNGIPIVGGGGGVFCVGKKEGKEGGEKKKKGKEREGGRPSDKTTERVTKKRNTGNTCICEEKFF